jgi:hypothetical protein
MRFGSLLRDQGGRDKLRAFKKPIIARIPGFRMGSDLPIETDLRIASADS